jgi:hypothetical protein
MDSDSGFVKEALFRGINNDTRPTAAYMDNDQKHPWRIIANH